MSHSMSDGVRRSSVLPSTSLVMSHGNTERREEFSLTRSLQVCDMQLHSVPSVGFIPESTCVKTFATNLSRAFMISLATSL